MTKQNEQPGKRKVLFLITSLYGGGAERVCCVLGSALAEKYDVLIAYRNELGRRYPLDPRCRTVHIPEPSGGRRRPVKKLLRPFRRLMEIRKIKRDFDPDTTISMLLPMNMINLVTGRKCRIICSERCNPKKVGLLDYPITRVLYRLSDHVVFQSEMVQDLYGKKVRSRSTVIKNPVSLKERASSTRSRRIINMGRLVDQKNQKLLIRSFADFHRQYPDYTLTIYGQGVLKDELEALARELGVGEYVELPGNVNNIHSRIKDAEMFVLSSDFEGMSNALLECFTMGICCISTRCEGSEDVIKDGRNGLLVPVGDQKSLTQAMLRLASDPALRKRLEEQAVTDAEEFRTERIVQKWEEILF